MIADGTKDGFRVETRYTADDVPYEVTVNIAEENRRKHQEELARQSQRSWDLYAALSLVVSEWDQRELFMLAANFAAASPDATQLELLLEVRDRSREIDVELWTGLRLMLGTSDAD